MKLKNSEILEARNALVAIDTGTPVKGADGKVSHEPFKIGGLVRLKLGRLHKRLEEECQLVGATERKLQEQYKIGNQPKVEEVAAYLKEWTTVLNAERDMQDTELTHADLQLETNAFPVKVLSGLAPFIKE